MKITWMAVVAAALASPFIADMDGVTASAHVWEGAGPRLV